MKKKKTKVKKTKLASSAVKKRDLKKKFGGVRELDVSQLHVNAVMIK